MLIESFDAELERLLQLQTDPKRQGVIGTIATRARSSVVKNVEKSKLLSPAKIRAIMRDIEQ